MSIKNYFVIAGAAIMMASCASTPVQTIENLKAAATGETTASTHYAAFSKKAAEEGNMRIANMFAATSYAESLHAAKHLEELAKLGVEGYEPVVEAFDVDSTFANLIDANKGEVYEFSTMYPDFMSVAEQEKANGALISFDWANRAEQKHSKFYLSAIDYLSDPERGDVAFISGWAVCTKCGDTYIASEVGDVCELCGTPVDKFKFFQI